MKRSKLRSFVTVTITATSVGWLYYCRVGIAGEALLAGTVALQVLANLELIWRRTCL